MPRSTDRHAGDAADARRPATTWSSCRRRPLLHGHDLHPGPRRHHDALGSQGAADAARGLRHGLPLRPRAGTGRSATTTSSRTTGRPSKRSAWRPTSRTRRTSGMTFPPGYVFPMRKHAAVLPRPGGRQGRGRHAGRTWTAIATAFRSGASRRPATASRTRPTTAATGIQARRRGQHPPGGGGRALPGQHQLRPHLPGPGQVPRGQDAGQGPQHRPGRHRDPVRRLPGARRHETGRVSGIEYKRYHDPSSPEHTTHTMRRARLRARRERDRERPAHARLEPAEHERPDGPQPDGPRVPAAVGAAARDRGHVPRHHLHRRDHGPARRAVPRAAGRLQRRHPQRRLGLGDRVAVLGPARHRRRPAQARPGPARRAGQPAFPAAAAGLHDRGGARAEPTGSPSIAGTGTRWAT